MLCDELAETVYEANSISSMMMIDSARYRVGLLRNHNTPGGHE